MSQVTSNVTSSLTVRVSQVVVTGEGDDARREIASGSGTLTGSGSTNPIPCDGKAHA